ncbi:hypothetical protein JCM21900_003793 [Sporobolomyces salmonicolor]
MAPSKRALVAGLLTTRRGIGTLVVLTCTTYVLLRSSRPTPALYDETTSTDRGAVPERWKESWTAGASRAAALGEAGKDLEAPTEPAGAEPRIDFEEREPAQVWTKVEMERLLDREVELLQQDEDGRAYGNAAEDDDDVPRRPARVDGLWAAERKPLRLDHLMRPPPPPPPPSSHDDRTTSSSHASHESILLPSSSDDDDDDEIDVDSDADPDPDAAAELYVEYTADYLSTPVSTARVPRPPAAPLDAGGAESDSDGATPAPDFSPEQEAEEDAPSAAANVAAADRAPMAALGPVNPGRLPAASKEEEEEDTDEEKVQKPKPKPKPKQKQEPKQKEQKNKPPTAELAAAGDSAKGRESADQGQEDPEEEEEEEEEDPAARTPLKIGTGGRVVMPDEGAAPHKVSQPQRVGAGAKAGAVVQEEAGKRVGTGARPGAKGMKVAAPEARRRRRSVRL